MLDGKPRDRRWTVPARGGSSDRGPANEAARNRNAGTRVLVVDDVEDNRDLYAMFFEHAGFQTDQACDGEAALAMVERRTPDAVIMDLTMPRLDGWETTRLIKSNPKTSDVVVIVVTGSASTTHLERARAAGADEICTKPCRPRSLLETVK